MQIVVLAAFMIVMMLRGASLDQTPGWLIAPAVGLYLLGALAISRINTVLYLRASARGEGRSPRAMKRHSLLATATRLWLLAGLVVIVLLGYGRWVDHGLHLATVPLAAEAVTLAPFVVGLLLVWLADYPFHREIWRASHPASEAARPGWSLGQYIDYNARHHLLFIAVPVGLIILLSDCLTLIVPRIVPAEHSEYVLAATTLLVACSVLATAPLLIVRIWKTAPLEDGPLRQELEAICRRFRLKYRDILVWKSDGMITNAAVLGLLGRVRYVLLSDGLLEQTDRRDIEAIFAHEAGHIIHHHILYSALFTIAVTNICILSTYWLMSLGNWPGWAIDAISLGLLAVVWGSGFGWVSRRFERQSDVTAAWISATPDEGEDPDLITHQGAAAFAKALQKVGDLNGIPPRRWNWRHGSLAHRIGYILWLGSTGQTRRGDDDLVRRLKRAILIMLAVGGALSAITAALAP